MDETETAVEITVPAQSRVRSWFSGSRRPAAGSRNQKTLNFHKRQFGPRCEFNGANELRVLQGELLGQGFGLRIETRGRETTIDLICEGHSIGQCAIHYNHWTRRITLWNIMLDEQWRGKGLASVLTGFGFRTMLTRHGPASLAFREVRLIDPNQAVASFKNIGIGLIAHQLGFEPDGDLGRMLRIENVESVELVSAKNGLPPGYMFMLKSAPHALAVFLIDPATGKPCTSGHRIYNSVITGEVIRHWLGQRMLVVGDANYILRSAGISDTIAHLAESETEAQSLAKLIRPAE
jgi:hypothetical protein